MTRHALAVPLAAPRLPGRPSNNSSGVTCCGATTMTPRLSFSPRVIGSQLLKAGTAGLQLTVARPLPVFKHLNGDLALYGATMTRFLMALAGPETKRRAFVL